MGTDMIFRFFAVLFLALTLVGVASAGYVGNDPMNYTDPTGMERAIGCEPLCSKQDIKDAGYDPSGPWGDPLSETPTEPPSQDTIDDYASLPATTDGYLGYTDNHPAAPKPDNSRNIWGHITNDAAETWYEVPLVAASEFYDICVAGGCGGVGGGSSGTVSLMSQQSFFGKYGTLWGRGGNQGHTILNSGYARVGYGWNNKTQSDVIRIAVGDKGSALHIHQQLYTVSRVKP